MTAVPDSNAAELLQPQANIFGGIQAVAEESCQQWKAKLDLSFEPAASNTILRRSHSGPLMVQRPFYPEGPVCHAYVLHPPGGIAGGDRLFLNTRCQTGASGLVTTPGAAKYYGSDGRLARQRQHISVGDASLEWMPQETIYFDRCRADQSLRIDLSPQSRFIGWDISCFGRPAGDHRFTTGDVTSRLELYVADDPLLIERLRLQGNSDLARISGVRDNVVSAVLLAYAGGSLHPELLAGVRNILPGGDHFAATQINNLIIIRYLGGSSEVARRGFVAAWHLLRPAIMQRVMVEPRIWAT